VNARSGPGAFEPKARGRFFPPASELVKLVRCCWRDLSIAGVFPVERMGDPSVCSKAPGPPMRHRHSKREGCSVGPRRIPTVDLCSAGVCALADLGTQSVWTSAALQEVSGGTIVPGAVRARINDVRYPPPGRRRLSYAGQRTVGPGAPQLRPTPAPPLGSPPAALSAVLSVLPAGTGSACKLEGCSEPPKARATM